MLADTNNDRAGLDEQYIVATNSSDLTLNPDRVCSATHLIAAGLLGNRMGAALVHLRSEWDAADKPRKMTEGEIVLRAGAMPKRHGKPDVKRARTEALIGYAVAMRHRAHRLAGWLPALSIMAEWAQLRGVDVDLLSPSLYHYLNPTCPVCDGHGVRKIPDAPSLSAKQCHHCDGAGTWPRPHGAERVHNWLRGCVGKAKRERGDLMRGEGEVAPMADRLRREGGPEEEAEEAARTAAHFRDSMGRGRPRE